MPLCGSFSPLPNDRIFHTNRGMRQFLLSCSLLIIGTAVLFSSETTEEINESAPEILLEPVAESATVDAPEIVNDVPPEIVELSPASFISWLQEMYGDNKPSTSGLLEEFSAEDMTHLDALAHSGALLTLMEIFQKAPQLSVQIESVETSNDSEADEFFSITQEDTGEESPGDLMEDVAEELAEEVTETEDTMPEAVPAPVRATEPILIGSAERIDLIAEEDLMILVTIYGTDIEITRQLLAEGQSHVLWTEKVLQMTTNNVEGLAIRYKGQTYRPSGSGPARFLFPSVNP